MVRSRGFPKSFSDVTRSRNQLKTIIFSLFPACNDPDLKSGLPFKADAIIGNQIAYGHQHVAKALNIPLQLLLMAPITPTSEFPNPFCRLKHKAVYKISHYIYDALMWLGSRDFINSMRKSLNLRPVTYLRSVKGTLYDLPTIYAFSSLLLPKPKEWGENIEIIGPCFLQLPSDFEPPKTLTEWIKAGKKPIYVGFGSMPINDPDTIAQVIVEAFEITGQRCIFGKCWSNMDKLKCHKDLIYVVDDCPHDWLFKQCAAVVHHGGCGTTFAGLKAACPTTVVPFFGEQFIWAERVYQKGLGPYPIQIEEFSAKYLVDAINFMLNPEVKERAAKASEIIGLENGSDGAVKAFFKFYSIYINKTQQTST